MYVESGLLFKILISGIPDPLPCQEKQNCSEFKGVKSWILCILPSFSDVFTKQTTMLIWNLVPSTPLLMPV